MFSSFRQNMYGGDFVFVASPDQVAAIETPLLVAMGDDLHHAQSVSREIAGLAPNTALIERWKDDEVAADTDQAIKTFLAAHTPG